MMRDFSGDDVGTYRTAFKKSVFVGEIRTFQNGVVYIVVRFARMV